MTNPKSDHPEAKAWGHVDKRDAAQPEPDRKPWRKRPSFLDEAFQEEVKKEERRQATLHQE
ncbi:hypothetical protein D3C84_529600 [compost metagenome]